MDAIDPSKIVWETGDTPAPAASDRPDPAKVEWQTGSQQPAQQPMQQQVAGPPTSGLAEALKGGARGIFNLAQQTGKALDVSSVVPQKWQPAQSPELAGLTKQFAESIQPGKGATPIQQMLGTGSELASSMLPFSAGGPAASALRKAMEIAVPAAGGAVGEQLGGETGKMVGSLAAPFAQSGLSRVLSPKDEAVRMLTEGGVRPTPGQAAGGLLNRFEELPLVREVTLGSRNRAVDQFNKATINRALSPLGASVDEIGFNGFNKAEEIASNAYNQLLPKLNINYDRQAAVDYRNAVNDVAIPAVRAELKNVVDNVTRPFFTRPGQPIGKLNGEDMKAIDSELGRLARSYGSDPAINSREMANGLREVQGVMRSMVERQNPVYAKPLSDVNNAWAGLIRVERATNSAAKTDGVFSPSQFQQAVKTSDTSLRHRNFAKGKALLQDWSQAGVKVLGSNPNPHVPYSLISRGIGAAMAGGAAATGYGAPLAAGAGIGMSVYNPVTQSLLAHAMATRPEFMRQAGNMISPQMPGAAAMGAVPLFSQGQQ